jgi:hypothetical protein
MLRRIGRIITDDDTASGQPPRQGCNSTDRCSSPLPLLPLRPLRVCVTEMTAR